MFSFLALGVISMLITEPTEESVAFTVTFLSATGIPYGVVLWMWRRQVRVAAALEDPKHRLGLLLSPDVVVWAPNLNECTLLDRRLIAPVETFLPLAGRRGHREVRLVQELSGAERRVIIVLHPEEVHFQGTPRPWQRTSRHGAYALAE